MYCATGDIFRTDRGSVIAAADFETVHFARMERALYVAHIVAFIEEKGFDEYYVL